VSSINYNIFKKRRGKMNFIEEILKVMNEKDINAYQLEEEVGLSHSTISSWKRGTQPTIDKAIRVIKYLGLSADEIFDIIPKETILNNSNLIPLTTVKHWKTKEPFIKMGIENILDSNSIDEIHENAAMIKILLDAQ
jgi:transcriptional regulator with XRE-family HTH domain